jgi:hypothetical protein
MSTPTRPVSHAAIESVWGQAVHDYTFTPAGTILHGTVSTTCGATATQIRLDAADSDPGGWNVATLPGNATAPTGSDGLYIMVARLNTVNGNSAEFTRGFVSINGAVHQTITVPNAGGTNVSFSLVDVIDVTAGDVFTLSAQRIGSTSVDVTCHSFRLVRIGNGIGA